jgi:hypothetical protein
MKIDLTARDIEILLTLLADSVTDENGYKTPMAFSIEELAIIDKLEAALRKENLGEPELMDTGSPSGLMH